MATSSLHPHSSNPFRDPNRPRTPALTPQTTGASAHSPNPFLSPTERVSPQATGASQYITPEHTSAGAATPPALGALTPQATGALAFSTPTLTPIETQNTGTHPPFPPPIPQTNTRPTAATYVPPAGPPPSHNASSPTPNPTPNTTSKLGSAPPPGPSPQRSTYAPPPGPPPRSQPAPRASSPTPTISAIEPPPPYTPAADVRQGEIPLETGPRRAYAPEWHPDGQTWRNATALGSAGGNVPSPGRERPQPRPSVVVSQHTGGSNTSWNGYPGQNRPPPSHPALSSSPSLGRSNTTVGTSKSRAQPGPPTTVPTPGRALLYQGKVLAYPARYECDKCHLTGYQAYDPSNPCSQCWPLFGQPYEGALMYAPWDSPEDVTSDEQNLQRPLPGASPRPPPNTPGPSSRPFSHPQHSSYAGLGHPPGSLPPPDWSRPSSSLRPAATISYSSRPTFSGRPSGTVSYHARPPPGALVVQPGDPRIGGRMCWKCSGDGWQYKTMGLETKTCSACNGLGRLF